MTRNPQKPGSDEALDAGCRCPVMDNGHGRGNYGNGEKYGWWVVEDCPIHVMGVDSLNLKDGDDESD